MQSAVIWGGVAGVTAMWLVQVRAVGRRGVFPARAFAVCRCGLTACPLLLSLQPFDWIKAQLSGEPKKQ